MKKVIRSAILAFACVAGTASAQSFPEKPIRMLVGFAPGGVTDLVARLAATEISKQLGQPVVVENRVGAAGLLAANAVVQASPDGYTLFTGSASIIHPLFLKDNPIDAARQLAPVTVVAYGDWIFYVPGKLPVQRLDDLVAYAKANAGKFNFGAPSAVNDLLMKMVASRAGFTYTTIPYKSSDQIIVAMSSGEVQATFNALAGFQSHLSQGTLRALFTLSPQRSPLLPDVPTSAEFGLKDLQLRTSNSIWAAVGTPADVRNRLASAWTTALRSPEVIDQLRRMGQTPGGGSPDDARRAFDSDIRFYAEAVKLANYEPR